MPTLLLASTSLLAVSIFAIMAVHLRSTNAEDDQQQQIKLTKTHATGQQTAPILTVLPLEIRWMIWEQLFGDADEALFLRFPDGASSPVLAPALVCKQMLSEIRSILPRCIAIELRQEHDKCSKLPRLLRHGEFSILSSEDLTRVTRVSFKHYWQWSISEMTPLLHGMPNLRMIRWNDMGRSSKTAEHVNSTRERSSISNPRYRIWYKVLANGRRPEQSDADFSKTLCSALSSMLREKQMDWFLREFAYFREWRLGLPPRSSGSDIQCGIEAHMHVRDGGRPWLWLNPAKLCDRMVGFIY